MVSCYPWSNITQLIKIKVQLPRAESSQVATQQLASEPASAPFVLLKGWQKNIAKEGQTAAVTGPGTPRGMNAFPLPRPCDFGNSLQQAADARRVPPAAIDGNPQMRVMLIIPQNQPDAGMKVDVINRGLQAAYSTPQLRTGISLSKSCHSRGKVGWRLGSKRIKGQEMKTF